MRSPAAKRVRLFFSALTLIVLVGVLAGAWYYGHLRKSLPTLDGTISIPSLRAAITIERDSQGVPTIRGGSRQDVARALGFLHAQDRFFQMDLARRRPAGELSALIGAAALEMDKSARKHGFRRLAGAVYSRLPSAQKTLLETYAAGVNAGLAQLGSKPWEYHLLRAEPSAWKPEDSVLLIYAMTLDLQDEEGGYEQSLAAVRDQLGRAAIAFFAPLVGPTDAALDDTTAPLGPMPEARMIDVRKNPLQETAWFPTDDDSVLLGSNAFALAGSRSASGSGIVANDMHLALAVPNIWYRASLVFPHPVSGAAVRVTGVTLPGTPVVVAGSNGRVAWGFTNANVDVSDLVVIDRSTIDPMVYLRGDQLLQMERRTERIQVKGKDDVVIEVPWTIFGPLVGQGSDGKPLALKWTMHDPEAANFTLSEMETATSVEQAIDIAHRCGIPVQNMVVADQAGKIAWTLCGKLPQRFGLDGRLPISWTFGDRGWKGFLPAEQIPVLLAPPGGQLWTANQRLLGGDALTYLGDGGYERPPRAARIRDLLTPLQAAKPVDLLNVQLDVRAPHLDRWHALLEKTLASSPAGNEERASLARVLQPWHGEAKTDSVSYRMVRRFRFHVVQRVLPPIFLACTQAYPYFSYRRFHYEPALWRILEERPAHLLSPAHGSWDELLLNAADAVVEELDESHIALEKATWGQRNTARIVHPFGRLNQNLARWLSMPATPLPGDYDTPRVQAPDDGASERFVVSPGHEEVAIFHMPGGQSSHPLSPFFAAGHDDWVSGRASPFLPGATRHTLTLAPDTTAQSKQPSP